MAKEIACKYSKCIYLFGSYKILSSYKTNANKIGQSEELYKNQIHITKHMIWDTLYINWSSALLKLGNAEATLPPLVTIPFRNKYRVRNIMENNNLISYIILLTSVTRQVPCKLNSIDRKDINHSV